MGKNFPSIDISKKVNAVERHFNRLHGTQRDDEDKSSMNMDKVMQLQEILQHSMKGSRFSVFFNKHLRLHKHADSNVPAGFFPVTIMISQDIAANCRRQSDKDHIKVVVPPGIQTIYVAEHGVFQRFVRYCVVESARSLVLSALRDRESTVFINTDMLVLDASVEVIKSLWQESQHNIACVLKAIALDPENHDSPWNHLPVFFNLRDESRFSDARFILIEIIRQALTCFGVMCHNCQANKAQFSCSQMYYIIKNVFPPSPAHLLPTLPFLIFLAENNYQMIDRMFSDAIYSTLFSIFDSLRNSTSKLFAALLTNQDGSVDFVQQCRVLEYVFKKPRQQSGIIIVPRVWTTTENGNIVSCRQFLDRKFALLKKHNKPYPKDHPFAFIKPPSWALDADGQRRSYIEPWDTLTGIVRRDASDFRSDLYGEYCPYGSLMLHFFESENDMTDFNYWKSIRDIEDEWKSVHKHSSSKDVVERKELELKRDWWYSTMIYSIQFLFCCYSLVAKLCENRNMVAREFFCGSSKLKKEEFFIQTWGTRPQTPIVRHEGIDINDPQTHKSIIRFNNDGLSSVAAVTCIKPLNPSCAYEVAFPSRSFMYYEVSIESIQDIENAVLAIGWTIADRERNADEPSDGTGVGYFSHSWSIDGIRQVTYANATQILRPSMESFLVDLEKRMKTADEKRVKLLKQDCSVNQNMDRMKEAEHDCRIIAFQVKNKRDILDQLNAQIMATESRLRFALQTLGKVENSIRIRDLTDQELIAELDKKLPNAVVDRGVLCFHNSGALFGGANFTSEMKLAFDKHGRSAMPTSTRWKEKSVIGVWIDSDSREIGIVQDGVNDGCKHVVFKYEDYAFLDSNPNVNVTWREHNIVPCISGRAVTIKVNLGLQEGGKNNEFKFFDRESVNFYCNKLFDTSFKKIKCIQRGIFHTDEPHTLKENEFICIQFPSQKYEVPSVCSLQERRPYRVKVLSQTSFSLRDAVPNKCFQTATVVHPRIFVREKVSFATFEPCVLVHGQKAVDVTARWNEIFEKEKIREIALTEVVYENGSKRPIKFGLADIFCDPITGLHLFKDVSCELKTYPTYNISDVPISQCNFSYFRCQGFVAPSQEGMYSQVVPNFAYSDGTPVIPGYQSLLDLVFFSKLPCSFRASCVQVLRTAYIDQEPWFVTPPVNIFRSDRAHIEAAAATPGGGSYDLEELIAYGYIHEQSKFGDIWSLSAYSEADVRLFHDLYCAACWEMEKSFGQNPESHIKDFGDKNWNEKNLEKRKTFLLHGYKSPPGVFQLSTRDIVIFWGRAISQLMEEKMKQKVFLEKNQDSKVFCKELIDCLMVTLKFEFNESWIGIISIRSKIIQRIQQCVLSYLKEVGVAQEIADRKKADDRDQKIQNAAFPNKVTQSNFAQSQEAMSIFSTSWKTVLRFFSSNETHLPTSSTFTSCKHFVEHSAQRKAERKHQSYSSRIPREILRYSNFVNVQSLQSLATTVDGSRITAIQSLIHDIQQFELFASKRGNPSRTFTFVDWERKWSEPLSPQTQIEQPHVNASHKQVKTIYISSYSLFLHFAAEENFSRSFWRSFAWTLYAS
jgi:hypothetical protein